MWDKPLAVDSAFSPGDRVRLLRGCSPMRVVRLCKYKIECRYESDTYRCYQTRLYYPHQLVHFDEPNPEHMETPDMTQPQTGDLYVTKEEPQRYGTFVGQHGKKIVLAMKNGDNEVVAFDPDQIEEVRPFTVALKPISETGPVAHFQMPEGSVEVDDLVYHRSGVMARVTAVDTKAKSAAVFKGKKVVLSDVA